MSQPLDRGRISAKVGEYTDSQGQVKNRYATVGKATLWPTEQGKIAPNIKIELDVLPIGQIGTLEMNIFWQSEDQQQGQQQQQAPAPQYQQPATPQYQQPNQYQQK